MWPLELPQRGYEQRRFQKNKKLRRAGETHGGYQPRDDAGACHDDDGVNVCMYYCMPLLLTYFYIYIRPGGLPGPLNSAQLHREGGKRRIRIERTETKG